MDGIPTTPLAFAVFAALSLLAVVWTQLRTQNKEQGDRIKSLEVKGEDQGKYIAVLIAQMKAREDAHEAQREEHRNAMATLRADTYERLRSIDTKLDKLLGFGGARRESPFPGRPGEKT